MRKEDFLEDEVEVLVRSIRELARNASQTLRLPVDETEACELLEAIDSLEVQLEQRPSPTLSRWLTNLRRQVEIHAMACV